MYISSEGKELTSEKFQIADAIMVNMSIDVNDVPVSNYGIIKNFNKDNFRDTVIQLKLIINDFIQYNKLNSVTLDNVLYKDGEFIAYFSYLGNKIAVSA